MEVCEEIERTGREDGFDEQDEELSKLKVENTKLRHRLSILYKVN